MFTKEYLKEQLKTMGLCSTDTVLIHTSMRAVGEVENGADGVIDAFCEYLSDGLFLVPTHTWGNVTEEQPVYDVAGTPTCIGALPNVAAFRKDGVRSLHPSHSIWGHGERAAEFLKGEESLPTPMPPGSAWARLAEEQAKILLIGVKNNRNTFIHAVEELIDVPDRLRSISYTKYIHDAEGNVFESRMAAHYCSRSQDVSQQFVNFEKPLVELGAETFGKLGNAEVRIIDAAKCQEIICRIWERADRDLCVEYMDIPEEWYRE